MRKNTKPPGGNRGAFSFASTCGLPRDHKGQITVKYLLRGGAIGIA
jgi:hypothetical protein